MIRARLRTYAPLQRRSRKIRKQEPDFKKVYRLVDARSEGFCEVQLGDLRCQRRGRDHHHLSKPRRSPDNHVPSRIVHMCRGHHDRCAYPYRRGRLIVGPYFAGGFFLCYLVYASDKWAARQPKAAL